MRFSTEIATTYNGASLSLVLSFSISHISDLQVFQQPAAEMVVEIRVHVHEKGKKSTLAVTPK